MQAAWIRATAGAPTGYDANAVAYHQLPAFGAYFVAGCLIGQLQRENRGAGSFRMALAAWLGLGALLLLAGNSAAAEPTPENLARRARVSASSEYSADYRAAGAVDGEVPEEEGRDDARRAWCVQGASAQGRGSFTLEWPEPVAVAEVVYFGRTGWIITDQFKDYEIPATDH